MQQLGSLLQGHYYWVDVSTLEAAAGGQYEVGKFTGNVDESGKKKLYVFEGDNSQLFSVVAQKIGPCVENLWPLCQRITKIWWQCHAFTLLLFCIISDCVTRNESS